MAPDPAGSSADDPVADPEDAAGDAEDDAAGAGELVRPVVVLDANVLIPPGLRDLLLSCAHVGVFRPVWQVEIEDELARNSIRLGVERRRLSVEEATKGVEHALDQMTRAFPDASAPAELWVPLVGQMTCDVKDRHVLAVAVGTGATHLVTANTRDFPRHSRPPGLAVVKPDRFLRQQLARVPSLVVEAVEGMSARLKHPSQTPADIAAAIAGGDLAPRFGAELAALIAGYA